MDDDLADRCIAILCGSFKLTIEQGRALGNTDTEILNVLYEASCERIKGFEDECLELTNRAKRMIHDTT
jgi:hypothetical protein